MYNLKIIIHSNQNIKNLKIYLLKIKKFIKNKNLKIIGNIKLKQKNKIFTVLKSPHVHKKSREHFNYSFLKNLFYIKTNNIFSIFKFLFLLKKILPKGVLLKTKIIKN